MIRGSNRGRSLCRLRSRLGPGAGGVASLLRPADESRVNGRSPQPTEQEAQQAEIGCGLGGPDLRDSSKAAKDVDELYERLKRESAEDLKGRPSTESLTDSAAVGKGGVPSQ